MGIMQVVEEIIVGLEPRQSTVSSVYVKLSLCNISIL